MLSYDNDIVSTGHGPSTPDCHETWWEAASETSASFEPPQVDQPFVSIPETTLASDLATGLDMHETGLNNNLLVVGTPGGGKTSSLVKPNVMNLNSSYVVTDPKGALVEELGPGLREAGWEVLRLDFKDPSRSDVGWNPFELARDDEGRQFVADAITRVDGLSIDPFWQQAASLLLLALVEVAREVDERHGAKGAPTMRRAIELLDHIESPRSNNLGRRDENDMDLSGLFDIVDAIETGRGRPPQGGEGRDPRDLSYDEWIAVMGLGLRTRHPCFPGPGGIPGGALAGKPPTTDVPTRVYASKPDCNAVMYCKRFASAAGKTLRSIIITLWADLNAVKGAATLDVLDGRDALDLGDLGRRRMALFVVVSDTRRSLDPLVSVFYQQLFDALAEVADGPECAARGHRLAVPVRVILDDFANMTRIPHFDVYMAALRSRDIWLTVVIQAISQLEQRYGASWKTIVSCCDKQAFVAFNDAETGEYLQRLTRQSPERLRADASKGVLVLVRGRRLRACERYPWRKHPNYPLFEFAREWEQREAAMPQTEATGADGMLRTEATGAEGR